MYFGFNMTFFRNSFAGYLGMPRRYHTYPPNSRSTTSCRRPAPPILAVAYLLPLGYFAWSLLYERSAPKNPWQATGLEWTTESPPPPKNFDRQPRVDRSPYDYHARGQSAGLDPPEVQNERDVQ